MKQYVFGVDVGGTSIKVGFFKVLGLLPGKGLTSNSEIQGILLSVWEIPTDVSCNGENILTDLSSSIFSFLSENNIKKSECFGIGLGVPGPVLSDGTVIKCINLGWDVFNVKNKLQALTGLRVETDNDANVAALGEMWHGGGKGYKDLVLVTLGTGIGSGVIVDGKIISGTNGAAGEIGHICIDPDDKNLCSCGNSGCLEQYCSANGFTEMTRKFLSENPEAESMLRSPEILSQKLNIPISVKSGSGLDFLNSEMIINAAKAGDKSALMMVDRFGKILGRALAAVSCVINCEIFVIGGGMSKAGPFLLEAIQPYFKKYAFHASEDTEFALAKLGNNAGIYGGAYLLLDRVR